MNSKPQILLAGAFGGIFPSILYLATKLTGANPVMPQASFWLGVLLFAAMGAAATLVWTETALPKAFYLGAGLPSLLQVSTGYVSENKVKVSQLPSVVVSFLMQDAFAQSLPPLEDRKIVVTSDGRGASSAIFYSADGKKQVVPLARTGTQTITVPKDANEVGFALGESTSARAPLPASPTAMQQYKVEAKSDNWSGFKRALGVRGVSDYEVQVDRSPVQIPGAAKPQK